MLKEFKKFAMKGNVMDLAIAVIMGDAFGKIVSALVTSIITPLFGVIMGGVDFQELSYTIGDSKIAYGQFIQAIINFLIISFSIFMFLKIIGKITDKFKKQEDAKEPTPTVNASEAYLKEIRDLLLEQKNDAQ